jgi:hypothetical protein
VIISPAPLGRLASHDNVLFDLNQFAVRRRSLGADGHTRVC